MKKDVFIVDPPGPDVPGKYLLVVSRGGMFGGSTTAFAVDGVRLGYGSRGPIQGYRNVVGPLTNDIDIVVTFSPETSFIMMERTLVRPTNMTEIEIEDRRTAEEHKKVIEAEFPPEKHDAAAVTDDGRQRINAQGYL